MNSVQATQVFNSFFILVEQVSATEDKASIENVCTAIQEINNSPSVHKMAQILNKRFSSVNISRASPQEIITEKRLTTVNKALAKAQYRVSVQGKGFFAKIAAWFRYHFSSAEKLGFTQIRTETFHKLAKGVSIVAQSYLQKTNLPKMSADEQLEVLQDRLGEYAKNSYAFLGNTLHLIDSENNTQSYQVIQEFQGEDPVYYFVSNQSTLENEKSLSRCYESVDQFLAIEALKDSAVGEYVKIDEQRTKTGPEYIVMLRTNEGVEKKIVSAPCTISTGEEKYIDKNDFRLAKAEEFGVELAEKLMYRNAVVEAKNKKEAHQELHDTNGKLKATGNWVEYQENGKHTLCLVIKNDVGVSEIKEIPFDILPAQTLKKPFEKEIKMPFTALSAQNERVDAIERMREYSMPNIGQPALWDLMHPLDPKAQNKTPFILQPGQRPDEFVCISSPRVTPLEGIFFDRIDTLRVLPGGKIHDKGREYRNFQEYIFAHQISSFLPIAALQSKGVCEQSSLAEVERALSKVKEDCFQIWQERGENNKAYITIKNALGFSTFRCDFACVDGKNIQLSVGSYGPISIDDIDDLPDLLGCKSVQSIKTKDVLTSLVSEVKIDAMPLLKDHETGYTVGKDGEKYILTEFTKKKGFLSSAKIEEHSFEVTVLLNGSLQIGKSPEARICDLQTCRSEWGKKIYLPDLHVMHTKEVSQKNDIQQKMDVIQKNAGKGWCKTKEDAERLLAQAKSFEVAEGQYVMYAPAGSNRVIALYYDGEELVEVSINIEAKKHPDFSGIKKLNPLQESSLKTIQTSIQFAKTIKNYKGFFQGSNKEIENKLKTFLHNPVLGNLLPGTYGYTIQQEQGFDHVYITYFNENGEICQGEVNALSDIAKSGQTIKELSGNIDKWTKDAASQIRGHAGFKSNIYNETDLNKSATDIANYFNKTAIQSKGAWSVCEVYEKAPSMMEWLFGREKSNVFSVVVVGDNGQLKNYTVLVQQNGTFRLESTEMEYKRFDELLQAIDGKMPLSDLEKMKNKCDSCGQVVKKNQGYCEFEDRQEALQSLGRDNNGYAIMSLSQEGEYTLKYKGGLEIPFSTRDVPGHFVVKSGGRQSFDNLNTLIQAYVGNSALSWKRVAPEEKPIPTIPKEKIQEKQEPLIQEIPKPLKQEPLTRDKQIPDRNQKKDFPNILDRQNGNQNKPRIPGNDLQVPEQDFNVVRHGSQAISQNLKNMRAIENTKPQVPQQDSIMLRGDSQRVQPNQQNRLAIQGNIAQNSQNDSIVLANKNKLDVHQGKSVVFNQPVDGPYRVEFPEDDDYLPLPKSSMGNNPLAIENGNENHLVSIERRPSSLNNKVPALESGGNEKPIQSGMRALPPSTSSNKILDKIVRKDQEVVNTIGFSKISNYEPQFINLKTNNYYNFNTIAFRDAQIKLMGDLKRWKQDGFQISEKGAIQAFECLLAGTFDDYSTLEEIQKLPLNSNGGETAISIPTTMRIPDRNELLAWLYESARPSSGGSRVEEDD